jgi:competence ComEA-like helix-hairpin-helix protein
VDPLDQRRRELRVAWAAWLLAAAGWLVVLIEPDPVPRPAWRCDAACEAGAGRLLFGGTLDLNRASADDLGALPGIGPARARAIVEARERRPFRSVDELRAVHGIGPRTLAGLEGWVHVAPDAVDR